jgi:hypothetical protein
MPFINPIFKTDIRVAIYNKKINNSIFSSWAKVKHGVPQGSIIVFLIYMNVLPKAINNKSIPVLFADDTSILFTHYNLSDLKKTSTQHLIP